MNLGVAFRGVIVILSVVAVVAIVLFIVSVWIGLHLYRKYRCDKIFDPVIYAALDLPGQIESPSIPPKT